MKKEIVIDITEKDALKTVKEEIVAAANSERDVNLKIEINGYFPAKKESKDE